MGSFFTNIHVLRGSGTAEELREALFSQMPPSAKVAVAAHDSWPWAVLYEAGMESQDGSHDRHAARLSSSLNTTTVSTVVHDSDIVGMSVMRGGAEVASFVNWPGYFEGKKPEPKITGESIWAELLSSGASQAQLLTLFRTGETFAEETVRKIAPLLGWDPEYASVGFKYLDDLDDASRLAYRDGGRAVPAASPRPSGPPAAPSTIATSTAGGMKLVVRSKIRVKTGEKTQVGVNALCEGIVYRGVEMVLTGEALEQGLVVLRGLVDAGRRLADDPTTPAFVAETRDGQPAWVVSWPDREIGSEGSLHEQMRIAQQTMEEVRRKMLGAGASDALAVAAELQAKIVERAKQFQSARFAVAVVVEGARPGKSALDVTVRPLQKPDAAVRATVEVEVTG